MMGAFTFEIPRIEAGLKDYESLDGLRGFIDSGKAILDPKNLKQRWDLWSEMQGKSRTESRRKRSADDSKENEPPAPLAIGTERAAQRAKKSRRLNSASKLTRIWRRFDKYVENSINDLWYPWAVAILHYLDKQSTSEYVKFVFACSGNQTSVTLIHLLLIVVSHQPASTMQRVFQLIMSCV